jgi:hypothetical protein
MRPDQAYLTLESRHGGSTSAGPCSSSLCVSESSPWGTFRFRSDHLLDGYSGRSESTSEYPQLRHGRGPGRGAHSESENPGPGGPGPIRDAGDLQLKLASELESRPGPLNKKS